MHRSMPKSSPENVRNERTRVGIVVSRFNEPVSARLLEGARKTLREKGVAEEDIFIAWVPGAFEIPTIAARLAKTRKFDALIALGAVIRGETPHFDFICAEAARGIASIGIEIGIPCLFGVLTCDTLEQAMERSGGKGGNKGAEAALGALEMTALTRKIEGI